MRDWNVPGVLEDLRYAIRLLRRSPGFTAAALITLALGIGANTAVFSIVHGVLLKPLPFEESDRLASLWIQKEGSTSRSISVDSVNAIRKLSKSFEFSTAYQGVTVGGSNGLASVSLGVVSSDFFRLFRIQPQIGRDFTPDDLKADAPRVALISHEYWQSRFASDANVLGQVIDVPEGFSQLTIVGVLPAGVKDPSLGNPSSVWTIMIPEKGSLLKGYGIQFFGRLKSGITFPQAQAELSSLQDAILPPDNKGVSPGRPVIQPLLENFVASSRTTILTFAGAVVAVLLIVMVNLVGLELARLPRFENEFAIRTALGASRWRLMRLMLMKTTVLGVGGGLLGIAAAAATHRAMVDAIVGVSRKSDIQIDGIVLAVGLALSLATSLAIGIVPAFRAARLDLRDNMHSVARSYTATRGMRLFQNTLTATETGLALVLVIAAGLLINNLRLLLAEDLGLHPEGVSSVNYTLPINYVTPSQKIAFFSDVLTRLKGMSNVQKVAFSAVTPMRGGSYTSVTLPGSTTRFGLQQQGISADYFSLLQIPMLVGRSFTDDEVLNSAPVTVVSATLATKIWPGKNPLGQTFLRGKDPITVIGVVSDVQYGFYSNIQLKRSGLLTASSLTTERFTAYFPISLQLALDWSPARSAVVLLRTSGSAKDIVSVMTGMEPKLTTTPGSVSGFIADATAQQRFQTTVLTGFGITALLLASVGIYSVVAHSVVRRTREIGIRLALGARRAEVFGQICRQTLVPSMIGMLGGFGAAVALRRVLATYLYAVTPDDAPTYIVVSVIMICVVALACSIPASRATKLDPVSALRNE